MIRNAPPMRTTAHRKANKPVNTLRMLALVAVTYIMMILRITSNNPMDFSARVTQNDVPSSLMSTRPFRFVALLH